MYYSQSGFEIVFYSPCNITDLVYRGWVGGRGVGWGGGGGWQAGGGQKLPLGCIEWCCPLSRWQICTQPTGWVETDIVGSLTPSQLWLVRPSGPTGPVMHQCGLTWLAKSRLWKQTWLCIVTQLMFLDSAWVYLQYQAVNWISVLVRLGPVFPNPVTYYEIMLRIKHHTWLCSYLTM